MDGVRSADLGRRNEGRDVKVALRRIRGPDANRLVGEANVERPRIGFAMHRNRADAELPARSDDAKRDLSAVRDQDFLKHAQPRLILKSLWPYSTGLPFSTRISRMVQGNSASISFISFIASTMQSGCPLWTASPFSTKGFAVGLGAR